MCEILMNKREKTLQCFIRSTSDIVPLLLKEIPPERVTIMEELGRGAFGKVHKGILKEMPKVEVFFKPKEEREDHIKEGRVVAVKLLHGKESLHDIFATSVMRAFKFEEITMKRLVTQNFTVIGSILFNPFLGARKLEDDKITERYSVKHVEYRP